MKNEPDIIQIENVFYSEPYNSEKRLFLCVILQALLDVSKNIHYTTMIKLIKQEQSLGFLQGWSNVSEL